MKNFIWAKEFVLNLRPEMPGATSSKEPGGTFLPSIKFQFHMAVKLRLQRKGRKGAPFYHIVVADGRSPRDGRFIEKIGTYNPLTVPATIELSRDRALYWVGVGAQPTDTVRAILRFKGVLYERHLQRGLLKGALTEEQMQAKLEQYLSEKTQSVETAREQTAKQKADFRAKVDGVAKVKAKPVVEEEAPAVEEATEAVEAAAEEATEAAAEATETPADDAPAAE